MKIAFFDSGVGGLTVYKEVKALLPHENYIYLGDTMFMPYGEKSKEELLKITRRIFDFFQKAGVKAVVMACNTTSALVYEEIKNDYDFKIYPVIQSVAKVLSELNVEKLGVFATPATINSHAYSKYIKNKEVFEISCPEWVKIVENNEINTVQSIEKIRLKVEEMKKFNPEKIILGCTHYPYLAEVIGKFYSKKNLINPAKYFAEFIVNDLEKSEMLTNFSNGKTEFYVTSNPEKFTVAAKLFMEEKIIPELCLQQ